MYTGYRLLGWGGFSVYRKIPVFLKNRFFGFAKVQEPKKKTKRKKTKKRKKQDKKANVCAVSTLP
jgi:hypothetical protein